MKKRIKFDEIKQFFIELADGNHKKIQIEQLVINEMIFVDKSRDSLEKGFLFGSLKYIDTLLTWTAISLVCYVIFFN